MPLDMMIYLLHAVVVLSPHALRQYRHLDQERVPISSFKQIDMMTVIDQVPFCVANVKKKESKVR
jgi:hypothetical protein